MATWFDTSALDALLNVIKSVGASGKVLLINGYTQGQPYATVVGNAIGDADISSTDFTGPQAGTGDDRELVFDGKTGAATSTVSAGQPLHIAITNGVDTVLAVTDETSDQAISSGNQINFPSFTMTAKQPTQTA